MNSKYDVIIIGAGIGGLVCGCYLAKAGLKVLIAEQHKTPGGYCSSFKRNGYTFDVAVHYLGACREGGETNRVISELGLKPKLQLKRIDPSDKVVTPDHEVLISKDHEKTVENFKNTFPEDADSIQRFFSFIQRRDFLNLYSKIKNLTFETLLDSFFDNNKLKATISILLGNIGLPPSRVSALTAVTMFREFILDPGYYPVGGMQVFSNILSAKFQESGGRILHSSRVNKITIDGGRVSGVILDGGNLMESRYVVSNADATSTFNNLLDNAICNFGRTAKTLVPSVSAFAVYLGLSIDLKKTLRDHCSTWYFSSYDLDSCYGLSGDNIFKDNLDYVVCTFPSFHCSSSAPIGKTTIGLFICAPYKEKSFWDEYKNVLADKVIRKAEEIIPSLSSKIETMVIATPRTFERYTSNRNGAIYGWASFPNQVSRDTFPQESPIPGLYIAGHWTTSGLGQGGISVVAYAGRHAAKLILSRIRSS